MVCLGPRKKPAKKPQLLSPDDAAKNTRSVKPKRSLIGTRKSTATAASTATTTTNTANAKASNRRSVASRASLESTASKKTAALNTARSPSPRPRSPATRPQAPPPGTAPSARSSARPTSTHSRHASTASSVRKSPVAQLREEYDELKVQNSEHLQLIARQEEELKRLKEQLEHQHKDDAQDQQPPSQPPTPQPELRPSFSQLEFDALQQQSEEAVTKLHAKEQELQEREKQLRDLREQIETEKTPNAVATDELAERERALQEREKALEEQRTKWEAEKSQSKIEDAVAQLEKLKLENEEAVQRLAAKEKELEQLRAQDGQDSAQLEQIEQLNKQLEAEKQAHEESVRRHEEALAEKDALLAEQKHALDRLQESHEDQIRTLRTDQSSSILGLKQRHKQDMAHLQTRLQEAETKLKSSTNAEMMEDEIERILKEFEQAEHSHAAQIENMQQSHESELSNMQQSHADQITNLRKQQDQRQKKWTTRYLPTEAVSWPAPKPLSMLRKTNGPNARPSPAQRIASAAAHRANDEPILTPLDTKKVQVYISTVSGNPVIKRKQDEMLQLLKTNNIEHEIVDVAASEAALQYMKRSNNNGSTEGRAKEVPQLFVGGEYRGQFEDVSKSVEDDTLETLLRPAVERQLTDEEKAAIKKAEARKQERDDDPANAPPIRVLPPGPVELPTLKKTASLAKPGPVRAYRGDQDDDDALLKELEKEIQAGKVDAADI